MFHVICIRHYRFLPKKNHVDLVCHKNPSFFETLSSGSEMGLHFMFLAEAETNPLNSSSNHPIKEGIVLESELILPASGNVGNR